jgi:ketosteroid isomerase-like protein
MNGRTLLTLALCSLAATACQSAPPPATPVAANSETVKGVYEAFAKGDVPTVLAAMDSTIQWSEAESFMYADRNPYVGPQAVAEGVFQRVVTDVDSFTVSPRTFIDGGGTVVVEGRYKGKMKATGKPFDAQFAHVFEFRNGKIVRFQQYTDTKQWALAATR